MAQLRTGETRVFLFLRPWKLGLYFKGSCSFSFSIIYPFFTFKHVSPHCSVPCLTYKELKGNLFLVGGSRNPPWSSGWATCYLFTFKNNFAFGPALLAYERYFELLEKELLFLFSNFSCLDQCLIPIFHYGLPPFPFSTVIAIYFSNK